MLNQVRRTQFVDHGGVAGREALGEDPVHDAGGRFRGTGGAGLPGGVHNVGFRQLDAVSPPVDVTQLHWMP